MITRLLFCALLAVSLTSAYAHHSTIPPTEENEPASIFSALSHSEVVEVTLKTNLQQLEDNIKTEDYQPAEFTFTDKNGQTITSEVEVRPRGRFRRRVCSFPPLKMKFSKSQLANNGFVTFRTVKLVTHCLEDKSEATDNVLKEYLVYRIFNILTDKSYRVQLVKINYVDTEDSNEEFSRYAFIIEGTKEMANRLGGVESEEMNLGEEEVSTKDENLMAVFQYMIGNEDWNIPLLRNVKLVQPNDGGSMIPVPYDFDFSGLVDAPYAVPNVDHGLTSIKQRALLGWPVDPRQLKVHVSLFKLKRPLIEDLVRDFKLLGKYTRSEVMDYITSFYNDLDKIVAMNNEAVENKTKD